MLCCHVIPFTLFFLIPANLMRLSEFFTLYILLGARAVRGVDCVFMTGTKSSAFQRVCVSSDCSIWFAGPLCSYITSFFRAAGSEAERIGMEWAFVDDCVEYMLCSSPIYPRRFLFECCEN
jgi:hypothetical protein